jgi:hypothetical protein
MTMGESLRYSPAFYENEKIHWIYRRHTNFSMESIEQTFNGSADKPLSAKDFYKK